MPITFKSKHSPDILMLENVARELIRMMGHSGTLPGSWAPEDLPEALAKLESALAGGAAKPLDADRRRDDDDDNDRGRGVSAAHRALPLIEMLRRAQRDGDYVTWDKT